MKNFDPGISIVLLSFNSVATIGRTIRSVQSLSDDIHVVDSYSKDDTVELCRSLGCNVVQRAFSNYADQRNWAIDNLPIRHDWQMHVDADEEFTPELVSAIRAADLNNSPADGYIFGRKIVFFGKVLRHGAIGSTWHYRLFRTGYGRCEDRLYDQHFVGTGRTVKLPAFMLDHQDATLSEWTARHNRWSDMEAAEALRSARAEETSDDLQRVVRPNARGTVIERKRAVKAKYYSLPLFARAFAYFIYSYFIKLGFMDGRRGLIFCTLQSFWFRFLVDAKIYETQLAKHEVHDAR
ncbi:glycosyltransferase family 2 protein [Sphingomonas sp. H39-1-10]|uniref:glycosyltransferase family 2 protein n=1 Tax=Sphingomonas pollutisoli TaxID=3030829 RepID=UPI0023B90506|nr:glycosyltransferase family 2 protein [Sphingomonas pollutisoli]MDF0490941.1 glycosyltransferase family 2 protein [Sphingomonas pollutisoli]